MTKIVKVLRPVKYGEGEKYASVEVQLDDGTIGSVYIGGQAEAWFDSARNKIKVFILRRPKAK